MLFLSFHPSARPMARPGLLCGSGWGEAMHPSPGAGSGTRSGVGRSEPKRLHSGETEWLSCPDAKGVELVPCFERRGREHLRQSDAGSGRLAFEAKGEVHFDAVCEQQGRICTIGPRKENRISYPVTQKICLCLLEPDVDPCLLHAHALRCGMHGTCRRHTPRAVHPQPQPRVRLKRRQ